MTIHRILLMGNEHLKRTSAPVADPASPAIASLVTDLLDTINSVDGNGLAAPQIGVNLRVVVYRVPPHRIPKGARQQPVPWTTLINPLIEPQDDEKRPIWERCQSLPNLYGRVPRYNHVRLTYTTPAGTTETRIARGYHAMLLQHECDHLDGILYPMRMTDMRDLAFVSELMGDGRDFFSYTAAQFDGDDGAM
ncbi:MAG TPA: peptide deformylase [Casimicrobiaceae bacterium]|jgi:peptide deformylase|nr:peptide deformylase [Casimicrobiaceae bacterium]